VTTDSQQAARAALATFAAGRAALAQGVVIEPLAGGIINRSYRVQSAGVDWVLRLAGVSDDALGINRVGEVQAHRAAAALGFAPAIVHAAAEEGLLVTERLAGAVMGRDELRSPSALEALGQRLGALHAVPPPSGVRRVDIHDALAHYLELPGVPEGPVSRRDLGARLRWSLATYRRSGVALCHNDLHHQNIIAGERLWFVDWEYAGVGDPLFELAAVIGYHDLDGEARDVLLAAHGGAFKPQHVAQMCLVFDCLHALWLDAARGWDALPSARRESLLARLERDPSEREV
jgi:thiamine kinase